jgi:hypothetical protein
VTEAGNQADLLLAKVGDEIPGLPDHRSIPADHGRSSYAPIVNLATLVVSPPSGQSDSSALDRLYSRGQFNGLGL